MAFEQRANPDNQPCQTCVLKEVLRLELGARCCLMLEAVLEPVDLIVHHLHPQLRTTLSE